MIGFSANHLQIKATSKCVAIQAEFLQGFREVPIHLLPQQEGPHKKAHMVRITHESENLIPMLA